MSIIDSTLFFVPVAEVNANAESTFNDSEENVAGTGSIKNVYLQTELAQYFSPYH